MDGVILMAVLAPGIIGLFIFVIDIITGKSGTKGITQPYKTKSGVTHTAKKIRNQHIV